MSTLIHEDAGDNSGWLNKHRLAGYLDGFSAGVEAGRKRERAYRDKLAEQADFFDRLAAERRAEEGGQGGWRWEQISATSAEGRPH